MRIGAVEVFRALPYAAAPIGARRFCPPEPPESWAGVRDASTPGPMAMQNESSFQQLLGTTRPEMSEDCLTLDVWTSGPSDERRPVMVWIHGGTFLTGTSSSSWYDGHALSQRGVVLVCPNYRLGAFGFLDLTSLPGADELAPTSNLGLRDQVAALRWVRAEIAAFGGDPDNVTVFGESAGAMSIGTLLATPDANGLFGRAILQSGAASNVIDRGRAERVTGQFTATLESAGRSVNTALDVITAPADAILAAQRTIARQAGWLDLAFQPVVDGSFVPMDPLAGIAAGTVATSDVLIGVNAEEMRLFSLIDPTLDTSAEALDALVIATLGQRGRPLLDTYRAVMASASDLELWAAVIGDGGFTLPAHRLALAHLGAGGGRTVHQYWFEWATPSFGGILGACHVVDVPFVFGTLDRAGPALFLGPADAEMHALSDAIQKSWVAFAATGTPDTPGGVSPWPPYGPADLSTAVLGSDIGTGTHPRAHLLEVWPD